MTSHSSRNAGWKRTVTVVVATGALAAGLSVGIAPTALAAPADSATDSAGAPTPMTPDQALAAIDAQYDTGAGGGQVSNLIHSIMKLKAQGYAPSKGNGAAIVAAMNERPNQEPLIEALQATLVFQKRNQARAQAAVPPPSSTTTGMNQPGSQYDPNGNRNADGNGGGITITPPSQ